jgi:hypothetical protein
MHVRLHTTGGSVRTRAFRNLALALAILLASVALVQSQGASDSIVYVTKTGAKYHRDGCSSLSRSRIPIKLTLAASMYGPCKNCRPPVPQAAPAAEPLVPVETPKTTRSPVRSERCQATTKKGTQCLRQAKAGGTYCWQHGR